MAIARNGRRSHSTLGITDRLELTPSLSRRQDIGSQRHATAWLCSARKLKKLTRKMERPVT